MTRTGKSNTVKTTVSAVAIAAITDDIRIGQLIFDVNGEYANANHQDDGSSISDVFTSHTVRYRAIDTPGFLDLRTNFYTETAQALSLLQSLHKADPSLYTGQDIDTFIASTLEEPDQSAVGDWTRWETLKAIFQCMLFRAGYKAPEGLLVKVPLSAKLTSQMTRWAQSKTPPINVQIPTTDRLPLDQAGAWLDQIRATNLDLRAAQKAQGQVQVGLDRVSAAMLGLIHSWRLI